MRAFLPLVCLSLLACGQPRSTSALPQASSEVQSAAAPGPAQRVEPPQGAPGAVRSLRIASWNLEWLHRQDGAGPVPRRAQDYERLKRYAERLAADVVAVQEVDGPEALQRVFDPGQYELQLADERGNQRGGFALRRGLEIVRHPDVTALNTTGGLRNGVDVSVRTNGTSLRLLGVHLKSGCFDAPLHGTQSSCRKLRQQLPQLEQWIDARAAAGEPFAVLGDFNRQLRSGDAFYAELDDADPPSADLTLVTDGRQSTCWGGEYPHFIDHIALSRDAASWLVEGSFAQQEFDAADAPHRQRLSDHCPISVVLRPALGSSAPPFAAPPPSAPMQSAQPSAPVPAAPPPLPADTGRGPIKGNLSSRGKRLFHGPGCPQYERVQIDQAKGERWFASEAQALAAGWQRSPDCP